MWSHNHYEIASWNWLNNTKMNKIRVSKWNYMNYIHKENLKSIQEVRFCSSQCDNSTVRWHAHQRDEYNSSEDVNWSSEACSVMIDSFTSLSLPWGWLTSWFISHLASKLMQQILARRLWALPRLVPQWTLRSQNKCFSICETKTIQI